MSRSRFTPASAGGSWIRPSTRWAIYHRDNFRCVYCQSVGRLTIDHFIGAKNGSAHTHEHLVTACIACNSSKKALTTLEWFTRLRKKGIDTDAVRRRIAAAKTRPIDRAVGRFLAGPERSLDALDLSIPGLDML